MCSGNRWKRLEQCILGLVFIIIHTSPLGLSDILQTRLYRAPLNDPPKKYISHLKRKKCVFCVFSSRAAGSAFYLPITHYHAPAPSPLTEFQVLFLKAFDYLDIISLSAWLHRGTAWQIGLISSVVCLIALRMKPAKGAEISMVDSTAKAPWERGSRIYPHNRR